MSKLKLFLESSYGSLKQWKTSREIHLVLGNESCDLDSTICAIAYGYFLSVKLNIEKFKDVTVFPIINVDAEHFPMRTEHCTLLKNIDIDLNKLIYRSNIDFEELVKERRAAIKTYLVDHHVFCKRDEALKDSVYKIFDHRPLDESAKWSSGVELNIKLVGSCATLISNEFLKVNGVLFKELAYLLYCTIIFDTLALLPENKKATPLDIEVAEKLEKQFVFDEPRQKLFQRLVDLHADITNLTPKQLLIRDLKFVHNIPIPGLPMLIETFTTLPGVEQCLKGMAVKNNACYMVLVGIEAKPDVRRDIGIFFVNDDDKQKKLLLDEFKQKEDFRFEERSCVLKSVTILRQLNLEKSRKQIIPVVKSFIDRNEI